MFNLRVLREKLKRLNYNKALLTIPTAIIAFSLINSEKARNQLSFFLNYKHKNILYAKGGNGEEDEEKTANIKNINSRLMRIEKKMDYLLEKDSKDYVFENDFPKFHFSSQSDTNKDINDKNETLIKKILNEKIWKKLFMLTSEEGYNINDIIQSGVDNPEHPIGLVSYSKDCYYTFEDILITAAQLFHKRNLHLTKYENESNDMLISILNSMESILEKNIFEIKISTNRNLEGFPFSGKINRNQRREITSRLYEQLRKIENEIYENEEKGKFSFFEGKDQENKISKSNNFDPFFQSCGFYKDFPDGRMAYLSNDGNISIVTNIEDHMKIVLNLKNKGQTNDNNNNNELSIKGLIDYFEFLAKLEKANNFCYDDNLGYVNSLINNLGSGCNFTVTLKLPVENKSKFLENMKNNKDLKIVESSINLPNYSILEISNKSSFYNFRGFLLEMINNRNLLNE